MSGARPTPRLASALQTSLLEGCMLDLVFVLVTVGFFAVAIAYTRACDRL